MSYRMVSDLPINAEELRKRVKALCISGHPAGYHIDTDGKCEVFAEVEWPKQILTQEDKEALLQFALLNIMGQLGKYGCHLEGTEAIDKGSKWENLHCRKKLTTTIEHKDILD